MIGGRGLLQDTLSSNEQQITEWLRQGKCEDGISMNECEDGHK